MIFLASLPFETFPRYSLNRLINLAILLMYNGGGIRLINLRDLELLSRLLANIDSDLHTARLDLDFIHKVKLKIIPK